MSGFRTVLPVAPILGTEASHAEWYMYIEAYCKLKTWDGMLTDATVTPEHWPLVKMWLLTTVATEDRPIVYRAASFVAVLAELKSAHVMIDSVMAHKLKKELWRMKLLPNETPNQLISRVRMILC
jgi:hypothetical protein